MRLYNAVCAWLEAHAQQMGAEEASSRDTQLDALVETAHSYTSQPEMHAGHRGTTFDDDDGGAYKHRRIGFIRSTRLWIRYARELHGERHVRGPAPEELFTAEADRDTNYLPGDKVHITLKPNDVCEEFSGRHGVITYGPDNENGWLVSSAPGTLRCVATELTMLTRREDR